MIQDFTKEELAPAKDATELTLGGGALIALGAGLLLLCAMCFGIGYAVGHRSTPDQSAINDLPAQYSNNSVAPKGTGTKPGAAGQPPSQPQAPSTADGDGTATAEEQAGTTGSQAEVKPGADAQNRPGDSPADGMQPSSKLQVQPAKTAQGWMVQIAAVSHAEDAEVLIDALRKRGYSVAARRDAGDNLIHVQTGPFVNRNDANAMRQKLLSDGYNAIVQ
jgi:DedD protein